MVDEYGPRNVRKKSPSNGSTNPLPDMQILGSPNSTANRDMMSEILTNGDTFICVSIKHCGKRRNCW